MHYESLEEKIQTVGNPAEMMRNAQIGRYVFPIPAEFTNWMDEQRAWRHTAVIFDQSVHMTDLYVNGPDTKRLLSNLGINSFSNFGRNKGKQLICCNYDGYVIGDAILFGLEDDAVNIVGRPTVPNWVQFHADTGGYNVTVVRDERTADNPNKPRLTYRYEVQGPNAMKILEKVNEGPALTTKFFNMGEITIAGCKARTLAHGIVGAAGLELWGPAADGSKVRAALIKAGAEFGLRLAGSRAYSTVAVESGWIPSPLPAIYTGDKMKSYREWLSGNSFEAVSSLGGSFSSKNIEDFYLTPWDLDYDRVLNFDHDFIGRDALKKMVDRPHRKKVTLVWDKEDVLKTYAGLMEEGDMPKLMEMPAAYYSGHPYDHVMAGGRTAGLSTYTCYSANERAWMSLAMVEKEFSEPGTEVSVIWGEESGGSTKPMVERHRQVEIRATVQPWPIYSASRLTYRPRK